MKKTKLHRTLSKRLKEAINADIDEIYEDASYHSFDAHGALETLRDCGVTALPRTNKVIQEIERMENDSFSKLHEFWGLKKPFGLGNLTDE